MAARLKQTGCTDALIIPCGPALCRARREPCLAGAGRGSNRAWCCAAPDGGDVRALIIGIDAYRHVRPLKGAVADAQDMDTSLRRMGARDVTTLLDAQADRASILTAIDRLVARTQQSDLVVLSIAGHGAQEPEKVKGSEPDGMENVFLLPGFEPTATGSQQRILGREFNHFIKQFELRGAKVLFVADTCHGGGMARDVDPRAEEMSFRQVRTYSLPVDTLKPVTPTAEAYLTELDLDRTAFLAAVDRKTKAPEIRIPGVSGLRGALSYAIARSFEGNADSRQGWQDHPEGAVHACAAGGLPALGPAAEYRHDDFAEPRPQHRRGVPDDARRFGDRGCKCGAASIGLARARRPRLLPLRPLPRPRRLLRPRGRPRRRRRCRSGRCGSPRLTAKALISAA